eukprot:CAMPEP_0114496938 /NCGR_PEP_ID=MMETSP0109-20121206/6041_1 /TAXON_ID=29199 /ORGANISM="Chlorarachnion reptans, Strain CCCM449" /LENGTH=109 /DNA_ID=CAMNT_0001674253 /DNA_START=943 /DNA_END=1272 /DNA_ORIENTATION=+
MLGLQSRGVGPDSPSHALIDRGARRVWIGLCEPHQQVAGLLVDDAFEKDPGRGVVDAGDVGMDPRVLDEDIQPHLHRAEPWWEAEDEAKGLQDRPLGRLQGAEERVQDA